MCPSKHMPSSAPRLVGWTVMLWLKVRKPMFHFNNHSVSYTPAYVKEKKPGMTLKKKMGWWLDSV
jgi:hypothetical protein